MSLLDRLRDALVSLAPPEAEPTDEGDRLRVAAAALMVRTVDADGRVLPEERAALERALAETYDLDPAGVAALIVRGEGADRGATDLYEHTSVLRRRTEPEERAALVGLLYELAFADDELHEGEDATVTRISDLLGVDGRDRVLARKEAADRRGLPVLPTAGD